MDNKNNENKNDNNNNNNNRSYNNNNFTDNYGHNINPIDRSNSAASSLSSNSRTYINTQPSSMQNPTTTATTTTTTTLQPSLPPPPPQYTANNNNSQISIPVNNIEREEEKICKICHESSSSSPSFPPPEQSPPLSPTSSTSSTKSSLEPSFWAKLFGKKHKEKNKLISPCRCKGSLQYVHLECLNQWRKSNARSDSAYQCEVCKYRYKMYRPFIAHIIDSEIFLHLMTTVVFLLLVYLLSFLIEIIDFKWITPGGPAGEEEHDWKYIKVLNLYLVHIVISLCIISGCGLLFLLYIYIVGDTTLGGLRGCCAGPGSFGSSSSSYFCCASCMFVDSDGCGACVCVLFLIMAFWIFLLGIFGVLLISYLIIKNINNYFLDRIKETILEVKKN